MDLQDLAKKKVGVLGFGQEGKAVTAYLLRHGISPVLFDKRAWEKFDAEEQRYIDENKLDKFLGDNYLDNLIEVAIVFRSPGIWRLSPQLVEAEKSGLIITSQVKWFFDHCPAPIIGVTGTKGKGTTASLIAHILKSQYGEQQVFLTGNIGQVQPLDFLDELKSEHKIVYELSSFQLQDLTKSPHIAVVLMITADHLDVHASTEEYRQAKEAIVKYQQPPDFTIINDDFPAAKALGQIGQGKKLYFSRQHEVSQGAFVEDHQLHTRPIYKGGLSFDLTLLPLRGQHNWENAAAAILACLVAGASPDAINRALPTFVALPHRLQRLPEHNGIQFFNDSYSTTPDTAEAAVRSFHEPIILILGGSEKNADFTELSKVVAAAKNVKAVAAIGVTGPQIAKDLSEQGYGGKILQNFKNMEETLKGIKQIATPGDVVLLSPATASFDWYPNYTQRGKHFAQLVEKWGDL